MIHRLRRRLRADRRAETALEFALVSGVFILMLLAPIEIGLMIWTGGSLQEVAAQTARCAAISSCSNPASYAVSLANQWIGSGAVSAGNVSVKTTTTCNNASGNFEQASVSTSIWAGVLISPLTGTTQIATACFPL